jgi:hypothetical protein
LSRAADRRTGGAGGLVIRAGTQPSRDFPVVAAAPQRARVEVCGPGTVQLSGRGDSRFRVVVGNPRRLYLLER